MHVTKLLKLEIAKTMKLVGTLTRKKKDADNFIMEVAVVMIITLSVKMLVLDDVNENNCHHHNRLSHNHQPKVNWNHSSQNIVYCNQIRDHAVHSSQDTSMIVKLVFVMYSDMVDAVVIKITSKRPKIAKIDAEMYKTCAVYHPFVDAVKKMLHVTIMRAAMMNVFHSNIADAVATKTISIRLENANHNVNVDANKNRYQNNSQKLMT